MYAENSYEFKVRKKAIAYAIVDLTNRHSIGALALRNSQNKEIIGRFPKLKAKDTKITWSQIKFEPIKATIGTDIAGDTIGTTPVEITLDSNAKIKAEHVLVFRNPNKSYITNLNVLVTGKVAGSTTKVKVVAFGGDKTVAIPTGTIVTVSGKASKEGGINKATGLTVPTEQFNYTRILKSAKSISGTSAVTVDGKLTYDTPVAKELEEQTFRDFTSSVQNMCADGARANIDVDFDDGEGGIITQKVRNSGGAMYFVQHEFDSDGNEIGLATIDNENNAVLTTVMINGHLKKIYDKGGKANAMEVSSKKMMQLSGMKNNEVNILLQNGENATSIGGTLNKIKSPIDGTEIKNIYVNPNLADDEIFYFWEDNIAYVAMEGRELLVTAESANGKVDKSSLYLTGEASLVHLNAERDTYLVRGVG